MEIGTTVIVMIILAFCVCIPIGIIALITISVLALGKGIDIAKKKETIINEQYNKIIEEKKESGH